MKKKIYLTDVVLRDAHQSLLATRMLTEDMLAIAEELDKIGYWSLEAWGGATFDSCIRYLNEDPWERVAALKKRLPNTKVQMLLRGQNLLGYRHYADDVVEMFVKTAAEAGVDVFRVFDALNDTRNMKASFEAIKKTGKHIQGAMSYALTPVHTIDTYVRLAKELEEMGADSLCIKDMSGLLKPFVAFELVSQIKKETSIPLAVHSHATTGMSVATLLKSVEAGADILDTALSPLSMGTSHSPTETLIEILKDSNFDTGMEVKSLAVVAKHFRDIRKKYADFESSFSGVDPRILVAQVPGGMLSNLESQLRDQNALDKLDDVLDEIGFLQKDFGYPPLVTPTSQIVGTQAVFNVLFGRYKKLTAESKNLLVGNYGRTPEAPNKDLLQQALQELELSEPVTARPADAFPNELDSLRNELLEKTGQKEVSNRDLMTYAMFPQIALDFFNNRTAGPTVIKPQELASSHTTGGSEAAAAESFVVNVDGRDYAVSVREAGTILVDAAPSSDGGAVQSAATGDKVQRAPVAGTVIRNLFQNGQKVERGETIMIVESMKMELEIQADKAGIITYLKAAGQSIRQGETIAAFA